MASIASVYADIPLKSAARNDFRKPNAAALILRCAMLNMYPDVDSVMLSWARPKDMSPHRRWSRL